MFLAPNALKCYVFSSKRLEMNSYVSKTRCVETINVGEILCNGEYGILIRELEKFIKKLVNNTFGSPHFSSLSLPVRVRIA